MSIVYDIIRGRNRPPDTPRDREIALTVFGPDPSLISGELKPADLTQPDIHGRLNGRHLEFVVPGIMQGHALLKIDAAGYQAVTRSLMLPVSDAELEAVTLDPFPAPLPDPLVIAGKWFELSDGVRWTQIGCSDFRLLKRVLVDGDDIGPVIDQRAALGFNTLRIWGMGDWGDPRYRLYPQEYGDVYFQVLSELVERIGRAGLRIEFTVFADAPRVMPDQRMQQEHFARVCAELQRWPHVFIELINENDVAVNHIDARIFQRPIDVIVCHGSNGADAEPVTPAWDYVAYHNARPADWPRKVGHNAMEFADQFRVPCVTNETTRPNQGRGPISSDFFDAAASASLLCAGATYHCESGKLSELFAGVDLACAEAWVSGARAVPLQYQRGQYTAGHLNGCPLVHRDDWASRTYARIAGGDRACAVVLQRTAAWQQIATNGWRVEQQTESVIELVR